jgi:hypothetical protein
MSILIVYKEEDQSYYYVTSEGLVPVSSEEQVDSEE